MNGKTKAKLLETYGLTNLFHDTVGDWLINLGFKYDCSVKNYYMDGHENKDIILYRWKFTDRYLLLERRMFRCIQMKYGGSENYEGCEK